MNAPDAPPGWHLARVPSTAQHHVFQCLTCQQSSPPAATPENPEAWATHHALAHGKGQFRHTRFARTITDVWTAQPSPAARQRVSVDGDRVFQLLDVTAQQVHIGDMLAIDDHLHQVVDLRWTLSRKARIAFVTGRAEPYLLTTGTRYEVRRPYALQQRLVAQRRRRPEAGAQ